MWKRALLSRWRRHGTRSNQERVETRHLRPGFAGIRHDERGRTHPNGVPMTDRIEHIVAATDPRYLVSVGDADVLHPLCLVWFGKKDGTIYVEPRFPNVPGLMSVAYPDGEKLIDLRVAGSTASCLPKLSHHPSGRVHFSRTGQIESSVGMTSFPLGSGRGKVFDLKVWNAVRLPTTAKNRPQRGQVNFRFTKPLPGGVILTGNWVPIAHMLDEIPTDSAMANPTVRLSKYDDVPMFLARPPKGYAHRDHLLVLHLTEGDPGSDEELLMFFGAGFDPAKVDGNSQIIGALFPWHPFPEDASRLPSADWKPPIIDVAVEDTRNSTESEQSQKS
jgi:hypothetical protein